MMKLIFLGPPGSGKGTQAKLMPDFAHLSTGDMLRSEMEAGSEIGLSLKEHVSQGGYAPDDLMIHMIRKRITQPDCANGFILDGFPRTLVQAEALTDTIEIDRVIVFDADDALLTQRLCNRLGCQNCSAILTSRDTICPHCRCDHLVRRPDDHIEFVSKRLKTYREKTAPLIDFYEKLGLIVRVDASKQANTVDHTVRQILNAI